MSTKTGIILLLIVVVLFSIVAGIGFAKDDNEPAEDTPGWIDFLGDRLTIKRPLDKKDIGTIVPSIYKQQIQQGLIVLLPGNECTFIILKSSSLLPTVRVLDVHLEGGPDVQVVLKQKDKLTVKEILNGSGAGKEFSIYDEGGAISISTENTGNSSSQIRLDYAGTSDTR